MAWGRWSLLAVVVPRLLRRTTPAPGRLKWLAGIGGGMALLGGLSLWVGSANAWAAAGVAVGSLLALGAAFLLRMSPALAVSAVGVALSCAALVTSLAVISGFLDATARTIGRFSGHIVVTKYGLDFYEYSDVADRALADPRVLAASPFAYAMVSIARDRTDSSAVDDVAPVAEPLGDDPWDEALAADARLTASNGAATSTAALIEASPLIVVGKGIDPARAAGVSGFAALFGRGDLSGLRPGGAQRPGVVLGTDLATTLKVEIGDMVRVVVPHHRDGTDESLRAPPRHAMFEVLDTIDTGVHEFDRNLVLMHLSAAQSLFFGAMRATGVELDVRQLDQVDGVAEHLAALFPDPYRISTWRENNAGFIQVFEQSRTALALVLGLMILVAAFSLVASLMLLVRSKRHDIGVCLALGCDPGRVFWLFEAVGMVVGVLGAGAGVILGMIYCVALKSYRFPLADDVYPVDHLPVLVRIQDVAWPVTTALVLCTLVSGPVAAMAARVRVIAALNR